MEIQHFAIKYGPFYLARWWKGEVILDTDSSEAAEYSCPATAAMEAEEIQLPNARVVAYINGAYQEIGQ